MNLIIPKDADVYMQIKSIKTKLNLRHTTKNQQVISQFRNPFVPFLILNTLLGILSKTHSKYKL